jgi:hypothetical protein
MFWIIGSDACIIKKRCRYSDTQKGGIAARDE